MRSLVSPHFPPWGFWWGRDAASLPSPEPLVGDQDLTSQAIQLSHPAVLIPLRNDLQTKRAGSNVLAAHTVGFRPQQGQGLGEAG